MLFTILMGFNTIAVCWCAVCLTYLCVHTPYVRPDGQPDPPEGGALVRENDADDRFARDLAAIMGYTGDGEQR